MIKRKTAIAIGLIALVGMLANFFTKDRAP